MIGWNRSADPNQRCRVIATGNPPTSAEGQWVIRRWAAWLDKSHRNPAKPGELRWYTTIDGEDTEVAKDYLGPNGQRPRSRTFIPALLEDNPDLAETGYASVIEAMPEPLRTMMREGRFYVASRRIATLGTRPGTFADESARFVMQFKGFPIAFSQRILGRALFGGRGATKWERVMNNTRTSAH